MEVDPRHGRGAGGDRGAHDSRLQILAGDETRDRRAMLAIIRSTGLPAPDMQKWLDRCDVGPMIRPDFAWPDAKVILETDGKVHRRDERRVAHDSGPASLAAAADKRAVRAGGAGCGARAAVGA